MACKIIAYVTLIAVVRAGVVAPVVAAAKLEEFDPNPQYTFAYDVQDDLTGDSKNQYETRNGDIVQGRYSFIEADGSRRTVDYYADAINGFNAIVQREPGVVSVPTRLVASPARLVSPAPVVAPASIIAPARLAAPARVVVPARGVAPANVVAPARVVSPTTVVTPERVISPERLTAPVRVANPARFISVKAASPVVAAPVVATKVTQPIVATQPGPIRVPGFARFVTPAAPLAAPVAPGFLNSAFARFIQAPTAGVAAPVAKVAAPLTYPASLAYTAPFPAPYTKVVTPFGYSAAYNTFF